MDSLKNVCNEFEVKLNDEDLEHVLEILNPKKKGIHCF